MASKVGTVLVVLAMMNIMSPGVRTVDADKFSNAIPLQTKPIQDLAQFRANSLDIANEILSEVPSTYIASVVSGTASSRGAFVASNLVITVAHGIENEIDISVNGRPAYLVDIDRKKDYAILQTMYSNDVYVGVSKMNKYVTKEYIHGDSGSPILDKEGKLYGILIGKHKKTNEYVILKVRDILKNYDFMF